MSIYLILWSNLLRINQHLLLEEKLLFLLHDLPL